MLLFQKIIAILLTLINVLCFETGVRKFPVSELKKESDEVVISDKTESNLLATAEYAANIRNGVQCVYTDSKRSAYKMSNNDISLTHEMTSAVKTASLTDTDGGVYIKDSFRSFYCLTPGAKLYFENSATKARVNTIRLGEYYYDCHVRDLESPSFKVDKNYHVYADKLYMQYTLLAKKPTEKLYAFGSEISIPLCDADAILIKDKNGEHDGITGIDAQSVEFAAFDIKNVGVVGFIVPSDGSTSKLTVTLGAGGYTITQYAAYEPHTGVNDNAEQGGYALNNVTFGCRVYTDKTHDFSGIAQAAWEERHPLESITVEKGTANAAFVGYDALRGMYTVKMDGTHFQWAYDNPEYPFLAPVTVKGSGQDRILYMRAYTDSGCLEAAALLDSDMRLAPIDVQECKNFRGDGGEGFYSPIDYSYGDAIFPVKVGGNEALKFTVAHVYQNWGRYPIKQVSSIEFHTSYYHLSTGTTESNCFAPYFVGDKDGWTLPDFRTRSGNIWSGQPQFNSTGILKFMSYRDNYTDKTYYSEFSGSIIDSCGLAYTDMTNAYTDDLGKFSYTLRHVEMPQTDENRTYYSLRVKFNENVTYEDFRKNFDIFYFDGRFVKYDKVSFLNADNIPVVADVDISAGEKYYFLGTDAPFWGYSKVTADTEYRINECFGCNFALLIKNSRIVCGGEKTDIPLVFRDSSTADITMGALTLDMDTVSFKKGDTIDIDMILLPWGIGTEDNVNNVMKVREDSLLRPVTVTAEKGSVESDPYLPIVTAENNEAEFTLTGGRNNIAVTVKGFSSMLAPSVYRLVNGEWERYELASSNSYDGYTVRLQPDGRYSFSFICHVGDPSEINTFRITQ